MIVTLHPFTGMCILAPQSLTEEVPEEDVEPERDVTVEGLAEGNTTVEMMEGEARDKTKGRARG